MPAKQRVWMVLVLALAGAGVLALTTPRDGTRFVSVHAPSRARGAAKVRDAALAPGADTSRDTGADTASREAEDPPAKASAAEDAAPAAAAGSTSALKAPAPASREVAEAPAPRRSPPAAGRNLFRPLVAAAKPRGDLPPALMPLAAGDFGGLLPLPDPRFPGARRQREIWRYVGTVGLDGATYALIEEKRSKVGAYVQQGDTFRGGHIDLVRSGYVVVAIGSRRFTLPKASGLEEEPAEAPAAPAAPPGAPAAGRAADQPPAPGNAQASAQNPAEGAPAEAAVPSGDGGGGRRGGRRRWMQQQ